MEINLEVGQRWHIFLGHRHGGAGAEEGSLEWAGQEEQLHSSSSLSQAQNQRELSVSISL